MFKLSFRNFAFIATCLIPVFVMAGESQNWPVCEGLSSRVEEGGVSADSLSDWVSRLDIPSFVALSKERAAWLQAEASLMGFSELSDSTWLQINTSVVNIYSGKWRASVGSVDINNDGSTDSIVVFSGLSPLKAAYTYILSADGGISREAVGADSRPLLISGEPFVFEGRTYWFQIDPPLADGVISPEIKYSRGVRLFRPDKGAEAFVLPAGVNGILCEFAIK